MDPADQRQPHLFIVRIWVEPTREVQKQWRGLVVHVPTGLRRYFVSLFDLNDFVSERLDGGIATEWEKRNR